MRLLRSAAIAFSMYSRVPVPIFEWDEDAMRHALACFPLVGVLEGILFYLLFLGLGRLGAPRLPAAILMTAFPVFYTGAIHLDGFLDTIDALSSNQSREKKLEILKDPHAGSFAILAAGLYLLAMTAGMYELKDPKTAAVIGCVFVLSRALSAFSLMILPNARNKGSAYAFSSGAERKSTAMAAIVFALCAAAVMLLISLPAASAAIALTMLSFGLYSWTAIREFGGITGDLAGFFVSLTEVVTIFGFSFLFS